MKNTASALRTFGGLITSRLSEGLKDNNSDASSDLDSSIKFKPTKSGDIDGIGVTMLDYYLELDEGVKPKGKQPSYTVQSSDIAEWLTYPNVKQKMEQRGFKVTERSIPSLAINIANRLTEDGRDGTNFFTNVINSKLVTRDLPKMLESAIGADLEDLLFVRIGKHRFLI